MDSDWHKGIVLQGDQYGRTLDFPTANLDPSILEHVNQEGVYAAEVIVDKHTYVGALYIGPRLTLDETNRVLEIHIIDFEAEIYGETIEFRLGAFIRPPMDFPGTEALKNRLQQDVIAIKNS